mmetsp:Transcript_102648/g.271159  ORF Transcript_102648/g.271159 Transcript_102648/m.271159 type:complete len:243 (+) Transcript_102648:652-1380(+)
MAATDKLASFTMLAASCRSTSRAAASALLDCSRATASWRLAKARFVFLSSPVTFASPVSSPHSSSVSSWCCSSRARTRTSASARACPTFSVISSRRASTASLWISASSVTWFSSAAVRSTLRCRWCSADSFCSRPYWKASSFCCIASCFSSSELSCARRWASQRPISSLKLRIVDTCSVAWNCPSWSSWMLLACVWTIPFTSSRSEAASVTLCIVGDVSSMIISRSLVSMLARAISLPARST